MITATDLGVLWDVYIATMGAPPRPDIYVDLRALWRLTMGEALEGDVEHAQRLHRLLSLASASEGALRASNAARHVVRAVWGERHPILRWGAPVRSWSHQAPSLPERGEWVAKTWPEVEGPGAEMAIPMTSRDLGDVAEMQWQHMCHCSPAWDQPPRGAVIIVQDWMGWQHRCWRDAGEWRWLQRR